MIAVGKVRMKMVVALNFKTDEERKYVEKLLNSDMSVTSKIRCA